MSEINDNRIHLHNIVEITLRKNADYAVTNHGGAVWSKDDDRQTTFVMHEGNMTVSVPSADDVIKIVTTSPISAKIINRTLGKKVAYYDKKRANSRCKINTKTMTLDEMIKTACELNIICMGYDPDSGDTCLFVYDDMIPLTDTNGNRIHHAVSVNISDIETSLTNAKYKDLKPIMQGKYGIKLPYVKYSPILSNAETVLGTDVMIDKTVEGLCDLTQELLRIKRTPPTEDNPPCLNGTIANVLTALSYVIMAYGNAKTIQDAMDRSLVKFLQQIETKAKAKDLI